MSNVYGFDVSFYQDDNATPKGIDFEKMKSEGASFVIIRAGQNKWLDEDVKKNWKSAKLANLPRGSYWFYDSRVSPKIQAELWIGALDGDFGELPLWCDFEDRYGGQYGSWKNFYDFIVRLQELAPKKEIGIYTGYYYWLEKTAGAPKASRDWFKKFPLWIAAYKVDKPRIPYPFTEWAFWQYTDEGDGKKYGVESKELDSNYFNGDISTFVKRFSLEIDEVQDKPKRIPILALLQNYALSLGGSQEKFGYIYEESEGSQQREATLLLQYILELDVKIQGG